MTFSYQRMMIQVVGSSLKHRGIAMACDFRTRGQGAKKACRKGWVRAVPTDECGQENPVRPPGRLCGSF